MSTRELAPVPYCGVVRWRRLPVLRVDWLPDQRRPACTVETPAVAPSRRSSPVIQKGYRAGLKPANHGRRFPASPPSPEEMLRLLDVVCDPANPTKRGFRNRALLTTLWRSGLRCSEALALLPHEVDFKEQTVTVMSGKGGKRRVTGIDTGALLEISRWLLLRAMLGVPDGSPLFCTVNQPDPGRRLGTAYVRGLVRTMRVRAGIPHRVAPHQLRHSFACEMIREGKSMRVLQLALGHSSLATTTTYAMGITGGEAVEAVAGRSWPGSAS